MPPPSPAWGPPTQPSPTPPPERSGGRPGLRIALVVIGVVLLAALGTVLISSDDDEEVPPPVASATPTTSTSDLEESLDDLDNPPTGPPTGLPTGTPTDGASEIPVIPLPSSTASPNASPGPAGEEASVFDLGVGDCFNDATSSDEIQSVTVVPCSAVHDNEVFGLAIFEGGAEAPFPGLQVLNSFGEEHCRGQVFTDYVGVEYQESRYYAAQLTPTEQSWEQGDREVVCLLYVDVTQGSTGSARGSNE